MFAGLGGLGGLFWITMIYDCVKNEPERDRWLWVVLMFNIPGSVIYFLTRFLPRMNVPGMAVNFGPFSRWMRRRDLWNAENAARSVGTAHHWTVYGNLLSDVGSRAQAAEAYRKALEKDPAYPDALWGAGRLATDAGDYAAGKAHLEKLLALEPAHKYGSASMQYGRAILGLGELDAARAHLEKHLTRWGHPEVQMMLAAILRQQGDVAGACARLEKMIGDVRGGPHYYFRANRHHLRTAQKMLRTWQAEAASAPKG